MREDTHATTLPQVDVEVLKLLWDDLRLRQAEKQGFGLTILQIIDGLKEHDIVLTKTAVQRIHLNRLRSDKLIVGRKFETNKKRGDRPLIYTLDRDNIITWPSTAFMLIQLWQTEFQAIERDDFVQQMLEKKIRNSSTPNRVADASGIIRQLNACADWGYIGYFNETVMKPSRRLEYELPYLEFVAAQLVTWQDGARTVR